MDRNTLIEKYKLLITERKVMLSSISELSSESSIFKLINSELSIFNEVVKDLKEMDSGDSILDYIGGLFNKAINNVEGLEKRVEELEGNAKKGL